MDRELERELDDLALLELREKEFYLRLRAIPEVSDKGIREQMIKVMAFFLYFEEEDTAAETDKV